MQHTESSRHRRHVLGVDIGGTFTDIVLLRSDGSLFSKKILSTPDDYSRAIEDGVSSLLAETQVAPGEIEEFAHGTTVATNAIIERKGVKVGLVTTKGFRDVLEIARFRSPRLYDLTYRKPEPLVERRLRLEVRERTLSDGQVELGPTEQSLEEAAKRLEAENVDAVAVCFLNSYVNAENETLAAQFLKERLPGRSICASIDLLPQINEYERTSTTVVNAYIRPVVERYVTSLSQRLQALKLQAPLMIMQSSGGLLPANLVAKNPVYIIESGPAAGVVGAQRLGERIGLRDVIVFDMGGTTAKASLIQDAAYGLCPETEVGGAAALGHRLIQGAGYLLQVPTIDIAEVGAGGGSIATVDAAGGLQVGPKSAGAAPGPVCYMRGGKSPTVTDANVVLGYLNPEALCGGELPIDATKAVAVIEELASKVGIGVTDCAYGIHLIANSTMMRALHGVTTERGRDASQFTLLAVGGNGGLHSGNLAEALNIARILIPPVSGLFSALGMLFADVEHHLVTGFYRRHDTCTPEELNAVAQPLVDQAKGLLKTEGFERDATRLQLLADMKYVGQTATISVAFDEIPVTLEGIKNLREAFSQAHVASYGYRSDDERVQLVALKLVAQGVSHESRIPEQIKRDRESGGRRATRRAYFGPEHDWIETVVATRIDLKAESREGPMIIEEYDATTVVRPGWRASVDAWNNIVLERSSLK